MTTNEKIKKLNQIWNTLLNNINNGGAKFNYQKAYCYYDEDNDVKYLFCDNSSIEGERIKIIYTDKIYKARCSCEIEKENFFDDVLYGWAKCDKFKDLKMQYNSLQHEIDECINSYEYKGKNITNNVMLPECRKYYNCEIDELEKYLEELSKKLKELHLEYIFLKKIKAIVDGITKDFY